MTKMMIIGRRRGGMTVQQLHRYLLDVHGPAVLRFIGTEPDLAPRRYVQNHVFDASTRVPAPAGAGADPFAASRDLVTQVWADNPAQAAAAVQSRYYLDVLQPDEDRFVDQSSVVKLPVAAHERLPADPPDAADAAYKLFAVLKRAESTTAGDLASAVDAAWPTHDASAHGIRQWVVNEPLARGSETPLADRIDELWFTDEAATRRAAAQWQALAEEGGALAALLAPGSTFVLLAREHVLHAGGGRSRQTDAAIAQPIRRMMCGDYPARDESGT